MFSSTPENYQALTSPPMIPVTVQTGEIEINAGSLNEVLFYLFPLKYLEITPHTTPAIIYNFNLQLYFYHPHMYIQQEVMFSQVCVSSGGPRSR